MKAFKETQVESDVLIIMSYGIHKFFFLFLSIKMAPVSKCKSKYIFSVDWFSNNIPRWEQYLKPLAGKKLTALEIGTYEGRSAIWLLENVLVHPACKLHVVDHFLNKHPSTKHDLYTTFTRNISQFVDKVIVHKDYSRNALRNDFHPHKAVFDIIYIDASRNSMNVIEDIILSVPLLKTGGLMILDDNTYSVEHNDTCPKQAIDAFRLIFASEIQVLTDGWQVIVKKKRAHPKRLLCNSEFWPKPRTASSR